MSKVKVGDEIKLIKKMGPFTEIGTVCKVEDVDDEGIRFYSPTYCRYGYMSEDELNTYFEIVKEDEDLSDDELQDSINELKEKLSKLEKIIEKRKKEKEVRICDLNIGDVFEQTGDYKKYVFLGINKDGAVTIEYNPIIVNPNWMVKRVDDQE